MGRFGKTGLKYKEEYVEQAYEILSSGKSMQELNTAFFVTEDTITNWRRLHDDFDNAIKLGRQAGIAWWLNHGRERMHDPDFNNAAFNTYLSRVYGIRMNKAKKIDLRAEKIVDSYKRLLEIMSGGDLDSKEATDLSKVLLNGATLVEHTELSDKMKALEDKMNETK